MDLLIQKDLLGITLGSKKKLVIIGAGGLGQVISQAAVHHGEYQVIGFCDDKYHKVNLEHDIFCAPLSFIKELVHLEQVYYFIAIGNGEIRQDISKRLGLIACRYATIIHPTAFVDNNVILGAGVAVLPHATIHSAAQIRNHVIINSASIIEHKNSLEDFVSISPNTTLCGAVTVERGAFVGAGTTVVQGVTIGEGTTIGAGSLVLKDIPSNCIAYGSPAKVMRYTRERTAVR
ncbi:acetyltransferase [Listeria grandensis]|uniref:acetyltransferase n=1 Tax=Listeria grandensis TaxID=1494963 RepID=UPI00164E3CFE|nr:acetyltransferase [Listeria grandensis]MBC6316038.1 acetyltransferase [Listeria grandensis]